MNLVELKNLLDWVAEDIQGAQVPQAYGGLVSKLQQNVKPGEEKVSFEAEKENLLRTLRSVPLHVLTMEQLAFLDRLGFTGFLGNAAAQWVEDILFCNGPQILDHPLS